MQLSCKMIRLDSHRRRLDPQPPHKEPCLVDCEFGNYWEVGCISTNFGNSHVFWWIGARVTYSYCACTRTCILDQTESSKPGCTWGATFEEHLTWGKPTKSYWGELWQRKREKDFQNDEDYMPTSHDPTTALRSLSKQQSAQNLKTSLSLLIISGYHNNPSAFESENNIIIIDNIKTSRHQVLILQNDHAYQQQKPNGQKPE